MMFNFFEKKIGNYGYRLRSSPFSPQLNLLLLLDIVLMILFSTLSLLFPFTFDMLIYMRVLLFVIIMTGQKLLKLKIKLNLWLAAPKGATLVN